MLMKAIDTVEQGGAPPMCLDPEQAATVRGPVIMDGIGPGGTAQALYEFGRGIDARRRARASWNAALPASPAAGSAAGSASGSAAEPAALPGAAPASDRSGA